MDMPTVMCCPAPLRAEALRRLFAANDSTQRESLGQAIAAADAEGQSAWAGLFIAGNPPQAAVWVQRTAGSTAIVWPPEPHAEAAADLLRAAAAYVDAQAIHLAQIIVSEHDGFDPHVMADCGFALLAKLLYLYADLPALFRDRSPSTQSPQFRGGAGDDAEALATLVERTYGGTLDCPSLNGVRSPADVLAGYRAQGEHLPQHWYVVADDRHQRRDLGVLILAEHPAARNWELIYMGVVPEARGRELGRQIVEFALETAARGRTERLVLAVDADNSPAIEMYRRAGFAEWDRRIVYARLTASPASTAPL